MIDKEIKEVLKEQGETFANLETKISGKKTNTLAAQMRRWTKRYNAVLKHIGYELTIKPLK